MHQPFDNYAQHDADETERLYRDPHRFAYKITADEAANLMVQKLRAGQVVLAGDVFVDVPSYKVSHRDPFPNPNGEMNLFGGDSVDFDKYNGIKR